MDALDALAIWKSIKRHHPFFKSGGLFGFDLRTMAMSYPRDAIILSTAIATYYANGGK